MADLLGSDFPKCCQKGKIADNTPEHFTYCAILTVQCTRHSSWLRNFDRKHTKDVIQRKIPRLLTDLEIRIHVSVLLRHLDLRSCLKKIRK